MPESGVLSTLIGKRFGRLVVLGRGKTDKKNLWLRCACDCGNVKDIRWHSIQHGFTKSCGCAQREPHFDLLGQRFGRLLVLEHAGSSWKTHGGGGSLWKCRCDCGKEVVKLGALLRCGNTKSCGCLVAEVRRTLNYKYANIAARRDPIIVGHNRLIAQYKSAAETRHRVWELTDERAIELFAGDCFYCGLAPSLSFRIRVTSNFVKSMKHALYYNGIDRLDNDLGYVEGNVVSCCWPCNELKASRGREEFLRMVMRIASHQAQKKQPLTLLQTA